MILLKVRQGLVPLRWGCALPSPNAPGKAPNHIHTTLRCLAPRSKGKARVELRPARRQSRLPHSRSLLLPGRER